MGGFVGGGVTAFLLVLFVFCFRFFCAILPFYILKNINNCLLILPLVGLPFMYDVFKKKSLITDLISDFKYCLSQKLSPA